MTKLDLSGLDERIGKFGPAEDRGPTVREADGAWWWADEVWQWHGPCSSEASARRRQGMYVAYCLEGFPSEESGRPWPVSQAAWDAAMDVEKENAIHPCHVAAPWDCECSGACGCHWESRKTVHCPRCDAPIDPHYTTTPGSGEENLCPVCGHTWEPAT